METLRTFGNYSITSEKDDKCPCKYQENICSWCMLIGMFSPIFCITFFNNSDTIHAIIFFFITIITIFVIIGVLQFGYGCGIRIRLEDNSYKSPTNSYSDITIKSKQYQFTNNPDYDASEIKKIVDEFEKYANELDATNKKREEEQQRLKQECCNKYKSVIQKVK